MIRRAAKAGPSQVILYKGEDEEWCSRYKTWVSSAGQADSTLQGPVQLARLIAHCKDPCLRDQTTAALQ
jgi:hypothetical protein